MLSRHQALTARHAGLEAAIATEAQRPLPDTLRLAELKREKLRLKDEISSIERRIRRRRRFGRVITPAPVGTDMLKSWASA